jgi:hypothetical protein
VYSRWLAASAASYVVLHHLGLSPDGLGAGPRDTQWVDWLDLLVPFLVLGPAATTLHAAQATARTWLLFGLGGVTYATGHGVHLAANSIGNAHPSTTAHLWDEQVGHVVWYAGVALLVVALATTMTDRPPPGLLGLALASLVGLTWASNAIGGGTVVMSLVLGAVAAAYGWTQRRGLAATLLVAGTVSTLVLLADLAADLA